MAATTSCNALNNADGRMPYAMTSSGSTYYLSYDQVGSLRVVADSSGTIVKRIDYDTFGNIISDSNSSSAVPFGFAGGLSDNDTGLIRFGFRDYLPEIDKWTAKDPILFAGGDSNLFGYCAGDPVNFVDPDGEFATVAGGALAGGIAGAVSSAIGSAVTGGSFSAIVQSAIVGGVTGAAVGAVVGGLAGAGIIGPLGLAFGDFVAGFNVGLGAEAGSIAGFFGGFVGSSE